MDNQKKANNRANGGYARAMALLPEQRVEIAKKAAATRWLRATHIGNFKKEFGLDIDCYVLNDSAKTAVISKRGMAIALGQKSGGGTYFQRTMNQKTIKEYLGTELLAKIENPLKFQLFRSGQNHPSTPTIHGYDSTLLIDICNAILRAKKDGALSKPQDRLAEQAQIIVSASAKAGIKGLVYALSGYQPQLEEVINAFKLYVQEEARKYEKEFPDELYREWYRLYRIEPPQKGKNWKAMHLTIDHIYTPLAKSNGHLLPLLREAKESQGDRNAKLFQFLNEIGAKALRLHIGRILGVAETSANRAEYEQRINKRFGLPTQPSLIPTYPIEQ